MSSAAPGGHLGVEYRDEYDLAVRLLPRVAATLERGGQVLAWLPAPAFQALQGELLAHGGSGTVTSLDPVTLGAEDDTVARQLRALTARGLPALVIASSALAHGHRPELARLPNDPHELICTWRHDAAPDVVHAHRRRHRRVLVDLTPAGLTATGSGVESNAARPAAAYVVAGPHGLRGLRIWVARLLRANGLDALGRARAALAVHEATLVAGRLSTIEADRADVNPTWVRASVEPGEFVIEIETRRPGRGLFAARSDEGLEAARACCDQLTWSWSGATSRIQLRVRASS